MKSEFGLSDGVQRQLVAKLFDQTTTLVVAGIGFAVVATVCWFRSGETWFAIWAALSLATLGARVALEWAFNHRRDPAEDIGKWRLRFVAGAWAMGGLWGASALTIVYHDDSFVQMYTISVLGVIVIGGAARNASSPLAARGQTLIGLVPLIVVCLASNDSYYRSFGLFPIFVLFAALTLSRNLYDHYVNFMSLNEQNIALVNEVQQANSELAAVNLRLEHAATTDSLTGIANRRRFDGSLAEEVRRAQRERSDLALVFLDIDSFKGFNDLYGHQAGDACLQRVSAALTSAFRRPGDLIARYGGEEFAAILPQTDLASAMTLAEAVRLAVEALQVRNAASPAGVVSISVGVAGFTPGRYRRPEDFIRGADEAMYAAKHAGRNCVRVTPLAATA